MWRVSISDQNCETEMKLKTKRKQFNIRMEILCMLPRYPETVTLRAIADDVESTVTAIKSLLTDMRRNGHAVTTTAIRPVGDDRIGLRAAIKCDAWAREQKLATEYWEIMYEPKPESIGDHKWNQ